MGTKETEVIDSVDITKEKDHSEPALKKCQDSVFSKLYSDPERAF